MYREVGPLIEKQSLIMRDTIPSDKRLLVTLHWLATGMRFYDLGEAWGMGLETARKIVHEVVPVMDRCFSHKTIVFPVGEELDLVMKDFERLMGLEQCGGAIDGTFVEIKKPSGEFGFRYWCYRGMVAMLVLATVDARGIFTYVHAGTAGCVGDAGVFGQTLLKTKIERGEWLPHAAGKDVSGVFVRPYLVADAAFAFSTTMMKGFNGHPAEGTLEHAYNYAHIRTRRVVENAFGVLKARFPVLGGKCNLNDVEFMRDVTVLCCALHNMCARHKDPWEPHWFPTVDPAGAVHDVRIDQTQRNNARGPDIVQAGNIRKALAQDVLAKGFF